MTTLGIILIPATILFIVGLIYLYRAGEFNFEFEKYKKAYEEYHKYVLTGNKCYANYATDFIAGNEYIKISSADEGNRKNQSLSSLFDLLSTGEDIVVKYFSMDKFRYKIEFQELLFEWNHFTPKVQKKESPLNFSDILILPKDKQIELIDKIKTYLSSDTIKGKSCAQLIQALRNNNYIYMKNNSHLIGEMKNYFNYDFGSYAGINDYLSNNNGKTMDNAEIEKLQTKFKIHLENENSN